MKNHDFLFTRILSTTGHRQRRAQDGFILRSDGWLYGREGQKRKPTTHELQTWEILDLQEKKRELAKRQKPAPNVKPSQTAQDRLKRNLSDTSTTEHNQEQKKPRTDDEDEEMEQDKETQETLGYWNTDAARSMTVRIMSTTLGQAMTQNDITHISKYHMRAAFAHAKDDVELWRKLDAERVSLVQPFMNARFKLTSKEGIDFWRKLIPVIPSTTGDITPGYIFLGPGETHREKLCFLISDAELALGQDEDMDMLKTCIKANNPKLDGVDFSITSGGMDPNSYKTIIFMELLRTDRERAFGPKPDKPNTYPNWKLRVGFGTVNVNIAFSKTAQRRARTDAPSSATTTTTTTVATTTASTTPTPTPTLKPAVTSTPTPILKPIVTSTPMVTAHETEEEEKPETLLDLEDMETDLKPDENIDLKILDEDPIETNRSKSPREQDLPSTDDERRKSF